MCTTTNAPKLASLRRNPAVALTIDTEVHPPKILLLRSDLLGELRVILDEQFAAKPMRVRYETWLWIATRT